MSARFEARLKLARARQRPGMALFLATLAVMNGASCQPPQSGEKRVDLLFASTRQLSETSDPSGFLGNKQGPLIFGRCRVRYAESPRAGRWSGYGDFFLPGDEREVVDAGTITRGEFVDALGAGDAKRVVLFVHGYSYGFGRGCRRVSDLQVVLGDSVQVVLFSWPSAGNPLRYGGDREALSASIPELASTLRLLVDIVGAPRLAIAAHSMGAFGVMEALRRFDTAEQGKLADLVFIAPDVDVETFRAQFPGYRDHVGRVTLYTSANDVLLGLSSLLNGGRRLGQGGEKALILPGLETVDISRVPRHHPAAHEYQYYNPHVVADLVELLRDGKGAAQRSGTTGCGEGGGRYWVLRERNSGGAEDTTRSQDTCALASQGR